MDDGTWTACLAASSIRKHPSAEKVICKCMPQCATESALNV